MLHGCESWVFLRGMKSKIQALGMKYLCKIQEMTMSDQIKNRNRNKSRATNKTNTIINSKETTDLVGTFKKMCL